MMSIAVRPIGFVTSTRRIVEDDLWDEETSSIELIEEFSPDALAGLTDFSHVEVVYYFDQVQEASIERGARHPRGNADWPNVGIFAQRGKNRPNRIGLTVAQVIAVQGRTITLRGLDAIHGSPVLDIKPFILEFGPRGPIRQPTWVAELMNNYWKATSGSNIPGVAN